MATRGRFYRLNEAKIKKLTELPAGIFKVGRVLDCREEKLSKFRNENRVVINGAVDSC
jgi:hypothetical protein